MITANKEQSVNVPDTTPDIMSELSQHFSEYSAHGSDIVLKKFCVKVVDVCKNVYSATNSPTEREIYRNMIKRLNEHLDTHKGD